MKYIVSTVLVILCFPLGQLAHKFLIGPYYVDKLEREAKKLAAENIVEVQVPGPGGTIAMKIDLRELKEGEVPEKVTLEKRVTVASKDGTSVALEAGTKVIVKSLEGKELVVGAMSGPLEGRTKIVDTDLPKQVADARAKELFGTAGTGGGETPAPTPGPKPPVPPVADTGGGSKPPTPPTPAPTPTPEPEPEPEPEPAPTAALTPEQIEALMQEHIKGGGVKEFKFEDVKGWKAGEEEDIDGVTYQTGMAAYQAETIFGPKTVQAKALIQNGKVVKWVYAKTGMEIR